MTSVEQLLAELAQWFASSGVMVLDHRWDMHISAYSHDRAFAYGHAHGLSLGLGMDQFGI